MCTLIYSKISVQNGEIYSKFSRQGLNLDHFALKYYSRFVYTFTNQLFSKFKPFSFKSKIVRNCSFSIEAVASYFNQPVQRSQFKSNHPGLCK